MYNFKIGSLTIVSLPTSAGLSAGQAVCPAFLTAKWSVDKYYRIIL
jgi:hypothetical protein